MPSHVFTHEEKDIIRELAKVDERIATYVTERMMHSYPPSQILVELDRVRDLIKQLQLL